MSGSINESIKSAYAFINRKECVMEMNKEAACLEVTLNFDF